MIFEAHMWQCNIKTPLVNQKTKTWTKINEENKSNSKKSKTRKTVNFFFCLKMLIEFHTKPKPMKLKLN